MVVWPSDISAWAVVVRWVGPSIRAMSEELVDDLWNSDEEMPSLRSYAGSDADMPPLVT